MFHVNRIEGITKLPESSAATQGLGFGAHSSIRLERGRVSSLFPSMTIFEVLLLADVPSPRRSIALRDALRQNAAGVALRILMSLSRTSAELGRR